MSRPLGFKRLALDEYNEAIAWYERQEPGLGRRFAAAADAAFERIKANPGLFRQVAPGVRKAQVSIFPYSIYFVETRGNIIVIAVHHGARNPAALKRRLR